MGDFKDHNRKEVMWINSEKSLELPKKFHYRILFCFPVYEKMPLSLYLIDTFSHFCKKADPDQAAHVRAA